MKRYGWAFGVALVIGLVAGVVTSQSVILQRPVSSLGLSSGVGYGSTEPTVANHGNPPTDGELFVVRNATVNHPVPEVYSALNSTWNKIQTTQFTAIREDFDHVGAAQAFEEDMTAAVVTDGGENIILMPNSQLGVIAYRLEAPDGPGLAATPAPFSVDGVLTLDGYTDDVANEGVELVFGSTGPDHLGAYLDEDANVTMYCEASVTLADISDLDDMWFGWVVQEAYDNPPASDTFDTSALFVISDAAGDLDIETELNGGGTLNDDTGVTWADAAAHTLRIDLGADAVSFTLDGAAVTQTNAVLNLDATDRAVCLFGYTIAAASDPQATINYVEIGVSQNQ